MRGIFEELRHRNVIRVAIAYIIAGWLIAQVADLAADAFSAPAWFMQMLIVLLLLGLPVALLLAWIYELTPDGVKKASELPEDAPKDPRSGRQLNRLTIIALVIAVAWLGWDKARGPGMVNEVTDTNKSIAVLPFDDFSPDGDHAWFADGLTEEILNSLARISDLNVASRTSSFNFRGSTEDIPAIAAQLDVAHILEGSVRRAGDQLRITAQLIRASDDKHLWSENFDGNIDNSIAIQEEIATQIANALQTAMDPEELARMISAGTTSVDAWEAYLQGLAIRGEALQRIDSSMLFDAARSFDEAVAIDPAFVDAHSMLAAIWYSQLDLTTTSYSVAGPPYAERRARHDAAVAAVAKHARTELDKLDAEYRLAAIDVRITEQVRLAERAATLEADDPRHWARLLEVYQLTEQPGKAREAGLKAWALLAEQDLPAANIVFFMRRVDLQEAVRMVDEMLAREDIPPPLYYQGQRALLEAGQIERAAGLVDKYIMRAADEEGILMVQVRQACAEGRVADADALYELVPQDSPTRWLFLQTLGRTDEAREFLRQYDTPEYLFILAGFLDYRTFDPRDYPLLWKTLQAQGIERPPVRMQTFMCQRDA